ncbi:cobalamin B12-binding domain-containing protein [Chloroflexota bacterium]
MNQRKIRVLLAKCGRDGHSRGATVVAGALRDAGMEVILTGIHQTVDESINAAAQENVDVLGFSQLDGTLKITLKRAVELLNEANARNILLIGGGIIPEDEKNEVKALGVAEIFGPGTPLAEIINFIKTNVS